MYPPPTGPALTAEQARALDDTYLGSDPLEYFRSRIASLLSWDETAPTPERTAPDRPPGKMRAQFNEYMQRPAADGPFKVADVRSQIAADAFSLRHHAAEALLRLACARLDPPATDGPRCLWADVSTGPTQVGDLLTRLGAVAQLPDASDRLLQVLVKPDARDTALSDPHIVSACNVVVEWLEYAKQLLRPAEIDRQAAHNKVKHGLAVRARSDMLVMFSEKGPSADGTVARSDLEGPTVRNILDHQVLEFLARAPKADGHAQGLEATQLRIRPSAVLVDAYMLAKAHALMFYVAALEHFDGRQDLPDHHTAPPFPGYQVGGPNPRNVDAHAPLGLRFPLTSPPGGGPLKRDAGIGFREYFQVLHIDYEGGTTARVVD